MPMSMPYPRCDVGMPMLHTCPALPATAWQYRSFTLASNH